MYQDLKNRRSASVDMKRSIKSALNGVNLFGVGLGDIYDKGVQHVQSLQAQKENLILNTTATNANATATQGMATAQTASTIATNAGSKAMKVFRIALISTGIGAIVVLIGSLVAYLSSTQKGIDTVTRVTKPLQVIFSRLEGVLQILGEKLFNTFSDPQQAIKDLWNLIKQNIVNRITGLKDVFINLGKVIKSTLELDFDSAKKSAEALGESVAQTLTGIDDLPNKIKNGAKQTADFFKESVQIGNQLRQIGIDIETKEAEISLIRAQSLDSIKEQELIAKDTTKTAIERKAAADQALRISRELATSEKEILLLKIQEEELQQSLNDSGRKDLQKLNELKAELINKDKEQKSTELRFLGTKTAIQKEQEARAKKAVDAAIQESKTLLEIYIAEQGVRAKTLSDELKMAEDVSEKKKEILKKELEAKKISRSEYNLAIIQLDNELLQKQAELAVDNAARELQIFKDSHQSKLDANTFFTDELLAQEVSRLDGIAEMEREFHKKKLDQGVSNQQEYNDAIKAIDDENRIAKEEMQISRQEAENEKKIIDLENQRIIDEENFLNQFEIQSNRLELKRQQEVANAKKSGADVQKINDKYAVFQKKVDEEKNKTIVENTAQTFGQIAQLFKKGSEVGQAFAVAQATMSGFQATMNAFTTAQKSPITTFFPGYPFVQAGIAGAFGAAKLQK